MKIIEIKPRRKRRSPEQIAGLDFAIETGLEHGGYVPGAGRQRTGESMTDTTWLSSQPLVSRENQKEHRGKRRHRDFQS